MVTYLYLKILLKDLDIINLFEDKGVHVDRIDVAKIFQHDIGEYYRLLGIIDKPKKTGKH